MTRVSLPIAPQWLRWAGVGVVASVIVYFSVLTTVPAPPDGPGPLWDKKLHIVAYAGFAYSLAYATIDRQHPATIRAGSVLATAVLFGLVIELLQGMLPMRYYSLVDLAANVIGSSLVLPWFLVESRFQHVRFVEIRR